MKGYERKMDSQQSREGNSFFPRTLHAFFLAVLRESGDGVGARVQLMGAGWERREGRWGDGRVTGVC